MVLDGSGSGRPREVFVDESNTDCAFACSGRDALHRSPADVADGEHSGQRCLKEKRAILVFVRLADINARAATSTRGRRLAGLCSGEDIAPVVALD